ncbi:MAG: hypothetical protein WA510_22790 [Acidobacteriaceae bacterium]
MKTSVIERRVGTREKAPERISLRAGALTMDFVAGGLRTIAYEGREILRAIAYVVRNADWGTYNPEISDYHLEKSDGAFKLTYRGNCTSSDPSQTLVYQASITANAEGHLLFEVNAVPLTPFVTARCGFAVLHPIDGVAGQPVVVEHVDGSQEEAGFPELIAPWQPFKDIRALQHQVTPEITARCRLDGDAFEMEDQRNWSDASYKTYVRPLALPWPYTLEVGFQQSVELEIKRKQGSRGKLAAKDTGPARVTVGVGEGAFPGIGVSIHPAQIAESLAHPELLNGLHPQHLLLHFDPTAGHGESDLRGFADIIHSVQGNPRPEVFLELVLPAQRSVRDELVGIAGMTAEAGLGLTGLMVSPAVDRQSTLPGSAWPACPPLAEIYQAAREAFPGIAIGGGTLSYFTELNRKRPPVELLDFVSHCTCPIVHAADDLSVMESLEAMPHIIRSTRAMIGKDKAYRIGPSTIGMRHNPYGARVMENPTGGRVTMTDRDPRQPSLFAAAWMIGYAAATAEGDLASLTVGNLTGPLGLARVDNLRKLVLHPAFYAARGLAEMGRNLRYRCHSSRPASVAAVAGAGRKGSRVALLANLTGRKQRVTVEADRQDGQDGQDGHDGQVQSVFSLDEKSLAEGGSDPWRQAEAASSVELLPYALACFRFTPA